MTGLDCKLWTMEYTTSEPMWPEFSLFWEVECDLVFVIRRLRISLVEYTYTHNVLRKKFFGEEFLRRRSFDPGIIVIP